MFRDCCSHAIFFCSKVVHWCGSTFAPSVNGATILGGRKCRHQSLIGVGGTGVEVGAFTDDRTGLLCASFCWYMWAEMNTYSVPAKGYLASPLGFKIAPVPLRVISSPAPWSVRGCCFGTSTPHKIEEASKNRLEQPIVASVSKASPTVAHVDYIQLCAPQKDEPSYLYFSSFNNTCTRSVVVHLSRTSHRSVNDRSVTSVAVERQLINENIFRVHST